jgi:hypothetical protein
MMHDHVNGIGRPRNPRHTAYNCARGINQGRNRAGPRRKPDDSHFRLINTAEVRAGQQMAYSDNDQLTMKNLVLPKLVLR